MFSKIFCSKKFIQFVCYILQVTLDKAFILALQPVKKESEHDTDPGLKMLSFERSPVMSTYLVAFIVGEYDYVEDHDADGVLVRVYTPLGKKEQGLFALNVSGNFVIDLLIYIINNNLFLFILINLK